MVDLKRTERVVTLLVALTIVLEGCARRGVARQGSVEEVINWTNPATWESNYCRKNRRQPLVVFGLTHSVKRPDASHCDPEYEAFADFMNRSFPSGALRYHETYRYARGASIHTMTTNEYFARIMDGAIAATPDCPMIVMNLKCFDADRAWGTTLGQNARSEVGASGITAGEIESILCNARRHDAALFFLNGRPLTRGEEDQFFGRYFPARCNEIEWSD